MTKEYKDINPSEYLDLLEKLVDKGELYNKTSHRFIYKWPVLRLCTEGAVSGEVETDNSFDPDVFIMFDPHVYKDIDKRKKVLAQIINSFSSKFYKQTDLNGIDWQGQDVYTMTGDKFRADYDIDDKDPTIARPNANAKSALRLCLDINEDIIWKCSWGDFKIGKGGTIATSQENIDNIKEAIKDTRNALNSVSDDEAKNDIIKQFLYADDGNAKFDVYGMKAGFRIQNYDIYSAVKPNSNILKKTGFSK